MVFFKQLSKYGEIAGFSRPVRKHEEGVRQNWQNLDPRKLVPLPRQRSPTRQKNFNTRPELRSTGRSPRQNCGSRWRWNRGAGRCARGATVSLSALISVVWGERIPLLHPPQCHQILSFWGQYCEAADPMKDPRFVKIRNFDEVCRSRQDRHPNDVNERAL